MLEKLRPEEVNGEVRQRLENLERELIELKKQQSEVLESGFKHMFEMSTMVAKEKTEWQNLHSTSKL